jgi:hypothetical protein
MKASKEIPQYVLYINMWGALSKLMQGGFEIFAPSDVVKCQKHFAQNLHFLEDEMNVTAYQSGDIAYVYSADLIDLITFASLLFQRTLICDGQFVLWPVRAAIACGIEFNSMTSKHGSPYVGRGNVEAAWLEKSAQKGMRLFATKEARESIDSIITREAPEDHSTSRPTGHSPSRSSENKNLMRPSRARGIEHFEINWLNIKTMAPELEIQIPINAKNLMQIEDDYCRQLSASLTDVLSWNFPN